MTQPKITVIGGGLAGSEAAWQIARAGFAVDLYEMRPKVSTGAHVGDKLAELVCSNSLGSREPDRAQGLLKEEMKRLGSHLLECAEATSVPAGSALAVDREAFAQKVTESLQSQTNINIIREECTSLPQGIVIVATGPLTSPAFSKILAEVTGREHLFFFDAIAPVVTSESINMDVAYRASRRDVGENILGDYINCPLNEEEYNRFVEELIRAPRIPLKDFEQELEGGVRTGAHQFFEGCLPVEIIAGRGHRALAFGPMRPVGLTNPRTGRWPHAVLQLRQDNLAGSLYNMVGFQTNLLYPEQERIFRLIPGLEHAEFVRLGQMHRNTFIASPLVLEATLQMKAHPHIFIAGQLTGVEGYLGNIATGMLAGLNAVRLALSQEMLTLPNTTMLGALCHYVTHADPADFQPMKANMGILPTLEHVAVLKKSERPRAYADRALKALQDYLGADALPAVMNHADGNGG